MKAKFLIINLLVFLFTLTITKTQKIVQQKDNDLLSKDLLNEDDFQDIDLADSGSDDSDDSDGDDSDDENSGLEGGDEKGGDEEAGDENGGDEEGGDEKGGDEEGGEEKGGDEEGGDEEGGDEQGGDEEAGDEQGGDEEGGDEEGGDEQGGDEEAGDEEGGDEQGGDEEAGDEQGGDEEAGDEEGGDEEPGDEEAGDEEGGNKQEGDDEEAGDEEAGDEGISEISPESVGVDFNQLGVTGLHFFPHKHSLVFKFRNKFEGENIQFTLPFGFMPGKFFLCEIEKDSKEAVCKIPEFHLVFPFMWGLFFEGLKTKYQFDIPKGLFADFDAKFGNYDKLPPLKLKLIDLLFVPGEHKMITLVSDQFGLKGDKVKFKVKGKELEFVYLETGSILTCDKIPEGLGEFSLADVEIVPEEGTEVEMSEELKAMKLDPNKETVDVKISAIEEGDADKKGTKLKMTLDKPLPAGSNIQMQLEINGQNVELPFIFEEQGVEGLCDLSPIPPMELKINKDTVKSITSSNEGFEISLDDGIDFTTTIPEKTVINLDYLGQNPLSPNEIIATSKEDLETTYKLKIGRDDTVTLKFDVDDKNTFKADTDKDGKEPKDFTGKIWVDGSYKFEDGSGENKLTFIPDQAAIYGTEIDLGKGKDDKIDVKIDGMLYDPNQKAVLIASKAKLPKGTEFMVSVGKEKLKCVYLTLGLIATCDVSKVKGKIDLSKLAFEGGFPGQIPKGFKFPEPFDPKKKMLAMLPFSGFAFNKASHEVNFKVQYPVEVGAFFFLMMKEGGRRFKCLFKSPLEASCDLKRFNGGVFSFDKFEIISEDPDFNFEVPQDFKEKYASITKDIKDGPEKEKNFENELKLTNVLFMPATLTAIVETDVKNTKKGDEMKLKLNGKSITCKFPKAGTKVECDLKELQGEEVDFSTAEPDFPKDQEILNGFKNEITGDQAKFKVEKGETKKVKLISLSPNSTFFELTVSESMPQESVIILLDGIQKKLTCKFEQTGTEAKCEMEKPRPEEISVDNAQLGEGIEGFELEEMTEPFTGILNEPPTQAKIVGIEMKDQHEFYLLFDMAKPFTEEATFNIIFDNGKEAKCTLPFEEVKATCKPRFRPPSPGEAEEPENKIELSPTNPMEIKLQNEKQKLQIVNGEELTGTIEIGKTNIAEIVPYKDGKFKVVLSAPVPLGMIWNMKIKEEVTTCVFVKEDQAEESLKNGAAKRRRIQATGEEEGAAPEEESKAEEPVLSKIAICEFNSTNVDEVEIKPEDIKVTGTKEVLEGGESEEVANATKLSQEIGIDQTLKEQESFKFAFKKLNIQITKVEPYGPGEIKLYLNDKLPEEFNKTETLKVGEKTKEVNIIGEEGQDYVIMKILQGEDDEADEEINVEPDMQERFLKVFILPGFHWHFHRKAFKKKFSLFRFKPAMLPGKPFGFNAKGGKGGKRAVRFGMLGKSKFPIKPGFQLKITIEKVGPRRMDDEPLQAVCTTPDKKEQVSKGTSQTELECALEGEHNENDISVNTNSGGTSDMLGGASFKAADIKNEVPEKLSDFYEIEIAKGKDKRSAQQVKNDYIIKIPLSNLPEKAIKHDKEALIQAKGAPSPSSFNCTANTTSQELECIYTGNKTKKFTPTSITIKEDIYQFKKVDQNRRRLEVPDEKAYISYQDQKDALEDSLILKENIGSFVPGGNHTNLIGEGTEGGLSTGAICGIVIGSIVVIAGIIAAAMLCTKKNPASNGNVIYYESQGNLKTSTTF